MQPLRSTTAATGAVIGAATGRLKEVTEGAFTMADTAVMKIALPLVGMLLFVNLVLVLISRVAPPVKFSNTASAAVIPDFIPVWVPLIFGTFMNPAPSPTSRSTFPR